MAKKNVNYKAENNTESPRPFIDLLLISIFFQVEADTLRVPTYYNIEIRVVSPFALIYPIFVFIKSQPILLYIEETIVKEEEEEKKRFEEGNLANFHFRLLSLKDAKSQIYPIQYYLECIPFNIFIWAFRHRDITTIIIIHRREGIA